MYNNKVDDNLFTRYDDVCERIESLEYIDKVVANAQAHWSQAASKLERCNRDLAKAKKDVEVYHERITRNENPGFIRYYFDLRYYIWWDRKVKVVRLKREREELVQTIPGLRAVAENACATEARLKEEFQKVKVTQNSRDSLKNQRHEMFERAVSSAPSERLRAIEGNISQQEHLRSVESTILNKLEQTLRLVSKGESQFQKAMQLLKQAQEKNQGARVINNVEVCCEYTGEEDQESFEENEQNLKRAEVQLQGERDRLVNSAQVPANEAYVSITNAWSHFPEEARSRYPVMASEIGRVPLARLQSASATETFLCDAMGTFGEAFNNNMMDQKIQENMQVVSQSLQIVATQKNLLQTLKTAIRNNLLMMNSQLTTLKQQLEEEKVVIFEGLHNRYLQGTINRSENTANKLLQVCQVPVMLP